MIQQNTKNKNIRRGAAAIAGLALAGGAMVMTVAPANAAGTGTWDALAKCESGGNWSINTGNGYYGAYQFAAGTWLGIGGGRYARYAHQAPKFAQDHMAYRLWKRSGWGPWGCA